MSVAPRHPSCAPRSAREISRYDLEADVVVVGLGMAGACAALEAQRAGSDVLVLERAGGGGGTSANSGGLIYLGGGTPVQKACGFDDTPEEMFRFLMAASQPGAREEKIRLFCEGSVEHFHWLEVQGLPFKRSFYPEPGMESPTDDCLVYSGGEDCHPWSALARPAPRGHKPRTEGKAGPFLMKKVLEAVARRGLRVQTDTRALTLVQEPSDGRIVGVVARRAGESMSVRARRGVVLCAGGFVMNDAMLMRHAPILARCSMRAGVEGDDGCGIRMGQAAGGDVVRMGQGEVALPTTIPNRLGRGIFVNRQGLRFINEDTYYGHIGIESLFRQGGRVYLLLDESTYERGLLGLEATFVAGSIAELEAEAGFPHGSLESTLAFYNQYAARGEDPLFHKRRELLQPLERPPFALVDSSTDAAIYATFTLGGLETGSDGKVLDPDGADVPGLYAAGRTAALFCGSGYPGSGSSLGDASFFGRRAGRAASRSGP
jgi:3-oxo-5alpha-steroid 4-dehydrogenase